MGKLTFQADIISTNYLASGLVTDGYWTHQYLQLPDGVMAMHCMSAACGIFLYSLLDRSFK